MTDEVARAFVLHRLNDGQLRALHARETKEGSLMTPGAIHDHFDTKPWGTVPSETQARVAPTIHAIIAAGEAQARAKGALFGPARQHVADVEIRARGLDFSFSSAMSSRAKVMKGYRPMDEEEDR